MSQWLASLVDGFGAPLVLAVGGLGVGLAFGAAAQRSRFCMRAAAIEFGRGRIGDKLAIWLVAFGMALLCVQAGLLSGCIDETRVRQISAPGSMSGAIIGGLIFGIGMVLTRACPSRMLVLSGQGNLRALVSGMIFAVAAAASYRGLLSPLREWLGGLWMVQPDQRNLVALFGLSAGLRLGIGLAALALALAVARHAGASPGRVIGAAGVGLAVAAAWWFSSAVAGASFDPVAVNGITFSGPSSDVLLRVISPPDRPLDFDTGLIPGVFAGALLAAILSGTWTLEGFGDGAGMRRYMAGAVLMGFGSMLAGGCAVGAGVTGGAVLSLTAWVALLFMWLGAMAADRLIDRAGHPTPALSPAAGAAS